jgi:hypothetical protein
MVTIAMKPKFILCLALVALNLSAYARAYRWWSDAELLAASDLVVIGQPIKVKDLDEVNTVLWSGNNKLLGVEATFAVSKVLKGDFTNRTVVLHYYRWENSYKTSDMESAIGSDVNSPFLIYLKPTDTNEFLLYLVSDGVSRFAPTSGQLDGATHSIKLLLANSFADTNLTKQISEILIECQKIKPGMTRAELLKAFDMEGGLSSATQRTFVYRGCPYIKVDVDFNLSDPQQKTLEERPTDTISKISKPYLDWSISD